MDDMTPETLMLTICANIRARRKELRMTQVQLADESGVQQSVISRIERGNPVISLESLAKISVALKTTPALLVTEGAYVESRKIAEPVA